MTDAERALYALHPSAFVKARNALAKARKRAGASEEAARLTKLVKPTASVWASNQLAHRSPEILAAYLESHHRARDRQLRALEENDLSTRELAATAARQERRMLEAAVEQARAFLVEAGLSASRPILDRVRTNLRGAVVDPEAQQRLEDGWLIADLEEPGFEALAQAVRASSPEWLAREIERLSSLREAQKKAAEPAPDHRPPSEAEEPPEEPLSEEEKKEERRRQAETEAAPRRLLKAEEAQRETLRARIDAELKAAAAAEGLELSRRHLHALEAALEKARAHHETVLEAFQVAQASLHDRRAEHHRARDEVDAAKAAARERVVVETER